MEKFITSLKEKMKSWAMWVAIAALIVFLVKQFGGVDISDDMNGFLDVLLPVLVAFGIVNNPNDSETI